MVEKIQKKRSIWDFFRVLATCKIAFTLCVLAALFFVFWAQPLLDLLGMKEAMKTFAKYQSELIDNLIILGPIAIGILIIAVIHHLWTEKESQKGEAS